MVVIDSLLNNLGAGWKNMEYPGHFDQGSFLKPPSEKGNFKKYGEDE